MTVNATCSWYYDGFHEISEDIKIIEEKGRGNHESVKKKMLRMKKREVIRAPPYFVTISSLTYALSIYLNSASS
ncbi:hypothetical protein BDV38DRAFT_60563 [Aspergillus pseudotamarii]|uniref:Transmembrane protein n=1 Tax=Aspergillus pseudotamarii TaxID=132259 RepID=A0A5N6SVT9_ASPPS|nr:uncharacterized protein BDV38DRAFT_60563 [Aspergillus pseudotamarii]KAE8138806.1 hypothetical protein BDV38DRAFT_60563 [Aspergillus pseudotamarii]